MNEIYIMLWRRHVHPRRLPARAVMPDDDAIAAVTAALGALDPNRLLTLGKAAPAHLDRFARNHPRCRVTHLDDARSIGDLPGPAAYDAVFLDAVLDHIPAAAGRQLLSHLRDRFSHELLVLAGPGGWSRADFLGMGFETAGGDPPGPRARSVYRYSMRDYKTTPDWLNSRFWANPGLFGKFRW